MERFIKLDKNDFIGREAAAKQLEDGPKLRRVTFLLDEGSADVMGDEPVWCKKGVSKPVIEEPHGHGGAPRFDEIGTQTEKPNAQQDGDWSVVGWITSGGYGHRV